jgi:riboflavin synthase, alpha subunit
MFNGLVREIAEVISFSGNFLNLKAKYRPDLGDSISVNGACLSVVKLFNDGFCVELSAETRKILALENFKNRVHIEPAMCLGDRIDGHLLQGHIDFIGSITKINKNENGTDFFVRLTPEAMKFVANKGSIGIDGISLTINEIMDQINEIRLTIIPITMKNTLFGEFHIGRKVNVETDLLMRYVARALNFKKGLTWEQVERFSNLF